MLIPLWKALKACRPRRVRCAGVAAVHRSDHARRNVSDCLYGLNTQRVQPANEFFVFAAIQRLERLRLPGLPPVAQRRAEDVSRVVVGVEPRFARVIRSRRSSELSTAFI